MLRNIKRVSTLALFASATVSFSAVSFAASAPVSDLNNSTSISTASQSATQNSVTNNTAKNSAIATNPVVNSKPETDIQRLERLLNNRSRVQLQMQQQLDQMSQEIDGLRGQIERNSYDMKQMLQRQRELFVELDKARESMKQVSKPIAAVATPAAKSGTYTSNTNEQTAYQNAVDLILKKRDYAGAIKAFQQFQQDFPKSSYTDNSHYWLGQLYFAKKQDKDAAKNFIAVISFPKSGKRADALVKLGDIALRNNNAVQAKKYYQQVLEEYPNSASAKLVQSKL